VRNALIIAGKELRVYFVSPLFYVITALFVALNGMFFATNLFNGLQATMRPTFNIALVIMVFAAPLLTMRLISQEKQQGTIELLLTSPIRDEEVVVGKFLAAVVMFLSMFAFTLVSVLALVWTSQTKVKILFLTVGHVDLGPLLTGYLGTILLVAGFLAIGIFASSVTQNQIIAAMIAFAVLLTDLIATSFGPILFSPPMSDLVEYVGYGKHVDAFSRGVISLPDMVYALTLIVLPLYLAVVALGARKWH
jgi:ABC-2 type transport system permease protein